MCQIVPEYMLKEIIHNSHARGVSGMAFLRALKPKENAGVLSQGDRIRFAEFSPSPNRFVYDGETKRALPGKLLRKEAGDPVDDKIVNNGYDFSGATWEYFRKFFGRDSTDNKGFPMHLTVHHDFKYPNAFYNGRQIAVGDGDGEIFRSFLILDIIGHEWGHGVVDHTANLIYRNQSGALNEHYADVFGMSVKQYVNKESVKESSWIVGEGIFQPSINGKGIRSFKNPGSAYQDDKIGKDRQPDHMDRIYTGPEDAGGVHVNSGILNKVFYEYANALGGNAYDKPAKIWYETLKTKLRPNSDFQHFVDSTQEVIISTYGVGTEYKALREAAKVVGLYPKP